ncbi:MAG: hypothetical protein QOH04_2307 [Sphingomonadales bacterium]|nr:hypothetical protein [Sphingomonadales bacterium]
MERLKDLVAAELAKPVDPRVSAMAAGIAARYPGAARALLFYGSCLRERRLEGLMLDFYLIVSSYRAAYGRSWLAPANRLIPPNVFPFEHEGLAAKYAVLSEADFARECSLEAGTVSVWARFAQPSRLVWAADDIARARAVASVTEAAPTLFQLTLPMLDEPVAWKPLDIWRFGFSLTYGAELRAERTRRAGSLLDADPARYSCFGEAALAEIARRMGAGPRGEVALYLSPEAAKRKWRWLRWKGKMLTLVRLLKAGLTYADGIDYLAWKINRHSGTKIVVKPWQRRWPLVAGLILLPRLLKRGAIR